VYIVDTSERPNLNSGRPPSTHLISDDTDYIPAHNDCSLQQQMYTVSQKKCLNFKTV